MSVCQKNRFSDGKGAGVHNIEWHIEAQVHGGDFVQELMERASEWIYFHGNVSCVLCWGDVPAGITAALQGTVLERGRNPSGSATDCISIFMGRWDLVCDGYA